MPTLSFEGETHDEIVQKVRRWLASVDGNLAGAMGAADVINQSAELTKDVLRVVAQSAPGSIGESELIKALTTMGYKATDQTREAALNALDAVETATGGSVVRKAATSGTKAVFEMNTTIAKQLLKAVVKD